MQPPPPTFGVASATVLRLVPLLHFLITVFTSSAIIDTRQFFSTLAERHM